MRNTLLDLLPHPVDLRINEVPQLMEGHLVDTLQLFALIPFVVFNVLDEYGLLAVYAVLELLLDLDLRLLQGSSGACWVVGAHIGPFWGVVGAGRVPVVGLAFGVGLGNGVFSFLAVGAEGHVDEGFSGFATRLLDGSEPLFWIFGVGLDNLRPGVGDDAGSCVFEAIGNAIIFADGADVLEDEMGVHSMYGVGADDWLAAIHFALVCDGLACPALVLLIVDLGHCAETRVDLAPNAIVLRVAGPVSMRGMLLVVLAGIDDDFLRQMHELSDATQRVIFGKRYFLS